MPKVLQLVDPDFETEFKALLALKLPATASFKLVGIRKVAREKVQSFMEMREEIAKKHCKKNEAGEPAVQMGPAGAQYQFDGGGAVAFQKEVKDLENVEVEGIPTISIEELGTAKENLTGAMVAALDGILLPG